MEDYKYLFKVVLIGEAGVGKTCLVRRFTQGLFPPGQGATIGVDFMIKTVEINGEKIKIWDTAGQERFRSITQSYYHSANALILVYDVCSQLSFDSLPHWIHEIEKYANTKVLSYLVGNKIDQINRREIPEHIGKQFAKRYEMNFMETSAKEAENVDTLFLDIAMELTKLARQQELDTDKSPTFSAGTTTVVSNCSSCFRF
ncbi:hypothetical protein FSP39_012578 [Pinctada imbricata]|uniref:Ras-related protein Rab-30 n=1 Tax=Pinctada imbricata TaxID=66713 RepID=A0AA89C3N9_PINIB|nr:hypothetical protein FSP39_012578 [Pinctada imbricata]